MDDSSEDQMDISDIDDDDDEIEIKDATYKVLSIDAVTDKMEKTIERVVSSTQMPATVARIALSQLNWDKDLLLEKFYDDLDKFFEKINVLNPFLDIATTSTATTSANTRECLTCYDKFPLNSIVSLGCNHAFCKDCWSQYLTVKINEGAELISCQSLNCDIIVDDPTVAYLLTDVKIKERYKRWITDSFVRSDPFLEWCPGPDCNNAMEASLTPIHLLDCTCDCGHEFCFECRADHHEPIPCNLYKMWQTQSTDANLRYMLENTKCCPKCDCLIEKNHGCDYMYCTRCRTEFCWQCFKKCFADWRYGHGMCNTPKNERPPVNHNGIRYKRYNTKYESNKLLFETEKQIIKVQLDRGNAESMRGKLMQSDLRLLQRGYEVVLACRKSLMMSYIFAYFVVEGNQKTIFEQNQHDLQNALDILSNYLQLDSTYENFEEANVQIKDKTEYCDQRRVKIRDHISEGLDKQWWTFYEE